MELPGELQRGLGRVGSALSPCWTTPIHPQPDRAHGIDHAAHPAIVANATLLFVIWRAA